MTATTPLTCDGFANALADYLERDDSPRVRAAVETHAASCAGCRALLADLQRLRVEAAGLPTLSPSRDLWAGVAERIATPVVALEGRGARPDEVRGPRSVGRGGRARLGWLRPAAAAAALVLVTAGVTYVATREAVLRGQAQVAAQPVDSAALDPAAMVAQANDSARRAEGIRTAAAGSEGDRAPRAADRAPNLTPRAADRGPNLRPRTADRVSAALASNSTPPPAAALETVYGREIARLWRIVDERRAQLDSTTVGVLERNLSIIDQAIRESRAALDRDPASAFLNEQLTNVLEQKVELLRAAALLPVRS